MTLQAGSVDAYRVQTLQHSEPLSSLDFAGWDLDYTQLSAGRYVGESQEVRLNDGLQLYSAHWNATLHQCGAAQPNCYIFGIPCGMGGEGRFNGQRWCGTIAAFRGEHEFDTLVPPMQLLVVSVSRDVFAEYLSTVEHVVGQEWLKRGVLLMEDPVRFSVAHETFTALIDSCRNDAGLMACPQARAGMMQTALEILAPLMLDSLAPAPAAFGGFSRTQIVRRAREFALGHLDEPLQIIDVCRALGVSRRGLQYSFQDVLDINPVTYLRLLRLNGARRDLINAGQKPVQVQEVVARWGFWHFSRFSAEYKKMFNELPSETLRRARQFAGH